MGLGWALLALGLLCGPPAMARGQGLSAEERQVAAEAAYDRGSAAFRGGDYPTAARWYETANDLAPSANALIQAIRAHDEAGNHLRAGTLAAALLHRYEDDGLVRYATPVLERVAPTAVRVNVRCDECEIVVGGEVEKLPSFFLRPHTEHRVVARFATGTVEERVTGGPGAVHDLSFTAPEHEVAATEPEVGTEERQPIEAPVEADRGEPRVEQGGGISPAFVVAGALLTVVAGGALLWSGLDTLSAAEDYEQMPTREKLEDGRDLELRTNVLIGATAGLGALTLLLAVLADWGGGGEAPPATLAPLPEGGALLSARGTFR